ncbi:WD40-repeat-containing domain protein [Absidia repens]|uniref:Protein HIR n=1 Tax=Absidia repens TaxID=90262 RepID=A0A1X2IMR4_9FUNG|nr:WD40-repeat-containing domain protein [Absidia repens]
MIIFKPDWIFHGGCVDSSDQSQETFKDKKQCIYSIDIHPDGKRLVTGSLDTTVKIWNTEPIYNEQAEKDPQCPKLLCTLTSHGGAVLCVRWSKNGRYLASSSDNDNVVIIWELDSEPSSASDFGDGEAKQETWRPVKHLRGHDSDVQDLAWSNDNRYLASCGIDGYAIIWDAQTFEVVHKITQHSGFVKGISFDPAGKYLASQSDDKKVKIWRTSDWHKEAEVKDPFYKTSGTTFFRRLSWSPDGAHLVAPSAMNGSHCVAAIIDRDHWDADVSLVGHSVPIEVAAYNPKLFYMIEEDEANDKEKQQDEDTVMENDDQNNNKKESLASVCALGGQDRGLSLWVTRRSRPMCVARDIFQNNVYDLAWAPNGQTLFACSQDGTVACLQLQDELEKPASDDEIVKKLTQYGYGRKNTELPEAHSQLELEAENTPHTQQTSHRIANIMSGVDTSELTPNTNGVVDKMELDESGSATDTTKQQEPNDTKASHTDRSPHQFTSSSSDVATITEQKVTVVNGKRRIQPVSVLRNSSSLSQSNETQSTQPSKSATNDIRQPSPQPSLDTVDYDPPSFSLGKKLVGSKRKAQHDESDDISNMTSSDNEIIRRKPTWIDAAVVPPIVSKSQVKLGLPKVKSTLANRSLIDSPGTIMECHNPSGRQGSENAKLVVSQHGNILWTDYLISAIILMTGNGFFSSVGCEDGTILIYSPAGRRLLPPIVLESTPVVMTCNTQWLLCLTATGLLYTWDVMQQKSQMSSVPISPLLHVAETVSSEESHTAPSLRDVRIQKNGSPLVITSYHQAFTYHAGMNSWLRISDAWFIISEFWGSGSSTIEQHPLGWLSTALTITGSHDSSNESIMTLAKLDSEAANTITISHIENQLAAALILESAKEYKEWMIYYARRLSKENAQAKVEELCQWLMGPPYIQMAEGNEWEATILNSISKHGLLKELLPILAQNRQLQRITTEFRSLL